MAKGQLSKGRRAIAGFACLAAVVSAPLAINSLQSNGISLAALDPAKKLSDLLDARSPGERVEGELTKTKIKKKTVSAGRRIQPGVPAETPEERLAQVVVPKEAEPLVPPAAATVPLVPPAAAEALVPASFGPLSAAPLVIGGGVLGGGGSGGGGGGGGSSPPPTTTPPVTSPVPEPSTWLMMLLGFGMVGAASRRRQLGARPVAA